MQQTIRFPCVAGLLQKVENLPPWVLLLVATLLYTPFTFLGYGSDSDSYSVVRTGQYFVETLDYLPSRLPGYFVHETFVYFLNLLGGSLLSNLGTMGMALLMLTSFRTLCVRLQVSHPALLTSILMVHPFVWVSATSTIDYLWALGFAFLGFNFLYSKRYTAASIAMALAIGSRLSTVMVIGFFLVYAFISLKEERHSVFFTALAAFAIGLLLYIPALDFLEWDISRWLVLSTGDSSLWAPVLRAGRFLYKNLMFWGLPAAVWLVILGIIAFFKQRDQQNFFRNGLTWLCLSIIIGVEVIFYRIPIEMEYLLPLLPFVLILLGKRFPQQPKWLLVLLFLVLLSNFLWLNPARSITPNQTSSVVYGLWLEPGYLLQDVATRLALLNP